MPCQKHRKLRYYELRRANVIVGLDGMIDGTLVSAGSPGGNPRDNLFRLIIRSSKASSE
jgi:hypothetical protein